MCVFLKAHIKKGLIGPKERAIHIVLTVPSLSATTKHWLPKLAAVEGHGESGSWKPGA